MTRETLFFIYLSVGILIALIHFVGPFILTRGHTPAMWWFDRNAGLLIGVLVGVLMWAIVIFLWPLWVVMITSILYKARKAKAKKAITKKIFDKHSKAN